MPASQTRKTAQPRRDTPAAISFNFDTWARDEAIDPFIVVLGGHRYQSLDPMGLDYRELAAAIDDEPGILFRLLFPDDADEMLENKIPIGALAKFNAAASAHFGLEDFIAAQS